MNSARPQLKLKPVKRRRRPATSEPTRDKLLDVAGRIFADRGYRAATIREICIAARANVAAVNYHFGDKLGLYTMVVQQSMQAAELEAFAPPSTSSRLPKTSCGRSFAHASTASAGAIGPTGTFASWSTNSPSPPPRCAASSARLAARSFNACWN
jgi:AcrR family transcriptional regulator